MNPRRFGNYVLLEKMATGGMGEVFSALHRTPAGFERLCAIKRILPSLSAEEEFLGRFRDESALVARINHPNVVAVNDMGCHGDDWYIAMEFVEGRDVGKLLTRCWRQRRTIPVPAALCVVREVLLALEYCHRQTDESGLDLGMVHRDISPANVLISFDGAVKLADFGLALSSMKMVRTQPDIVLGKPGYIAPERLRGERPDRRADLFCAGVLLFELLTCERFTQARDPALLRAEIQRRAQVRPSTIRAAVPQDVDRLLRRALAIKPQRRYQSAAEFYEAVQSALSSIDPNYGPWRLREVMESLCHPLQERRRLQAMVSQGRKLFGASDEVPNAPREVYGGKYTAGVAPTLIEEVFDGETEPVPLDIDDADVVEIVDRADWRTPAPRRPRRILSGQRPMVYRTTNSGRLVLVGGALRSRR